MIAGSLELDQPQQNSSQKENRYNFSSTRSSYHGTHGYSFDFCCLLLYFKHHICNKNTLYMKWYCITERHQQTKQLAVLIDWVQCGYV
jgi:hypothetical protein